MVDNDTDGERVNSGGVNDASWLPDGWNLAMSLGPHPIYKKDFVCYSPVIDCMKKYPLALQYEKLQGTLDLMITGKEVTEGAVVQIYDWTFDISEGRPE